MPQFVNFSKVMEVIDANPDLPIFTRHGFAFRGADLCEFKKEPVDFNTFVRDTHSLALITKRVHFDDWRAWLKHCYGNEPYLEVYLHPDKIIIQTYSENDMF